MMISFYHNEFCEDEHGSRKIVRPLACNYMP